MTNTSLSPTHIRFAPDEHGEEIAYLTMRSCGTEVELYARDLAALARKGVSWNWHLNTARGNGYVSVHDPDHLGQKQGVARLIALAGRGEAVRYRDGNRLNLRADNLYLSHGPSANGKTPKRPRQPDAAMPLVSADGGTA